MRKHYSISRGVFRIPDRSLNLYYKNFEYSCCEWVCIIADNKTLLNHQRWESAKIIIDHVIKGIEIARKHKLPERVIDFIRTHHGTNLVYYFYKKEEEVQGEAKEKDFRYPGPKPFSKETAILMMADSVEAASKSLKEPTSSKIDAFVENIVNNHMENGQFINANITFKEIEVIKKVLKKKLNNIYHLRVEYPE